MLAVYRFTSTCKVITRETDRTPEVRRTIDRSGILLFLDVVSGGRWIRRVEEFILKGEDLQAARKPTGIAKGDLRQLSRAYIKTFGSDEFAPSGEARFDSSQTGDDLTRSINIEPRPAGLPNRIGIELEHLCYPTLLPMLPSPPIDIGKSWKGTFPAAYGAGSFPGMGYEALIVDRKPDNPLIDVKFDPKPCTDPGEVSLIMTLGGGFRTLLSADDLAPLTARGDIRGVIDASFNRGDQPVKCKIVDYSLVYGMHRIPANFDDTTVYLFGCDPDFTNFYAKLLDDPPKPPELPEALRK
jgi:hypothetical protein